MKKTLCATGTILPLFFACLESPLSDVEITDFNLISGSFMIIKKCGETINTSIIQVIIHDKNLFSVQVKNGSVMVNGKTMRFNPLLNMYELDNISIVKDSTYTFITTLSNGDTCISVVKTPKVEFGQVSCPNPINTLQDSAITWTDFAGMGTNLDLSFQVNLCSDTPMVNQTIIQRTIADNGRFALTHDLFDHSCHLGNGNLSLKRQSTGKASGKLRIGSIVIASFEWNRTDVRLVK
jgi:hypothetical protein